MAKQSGLGDQAYHKANETLAQTILNNQTRLSRVRLYKALVVRYVRHGWDGALIQTFKTRHKLASELKNGKAFTPSRENQKFADLERAGLVGLDANGNVFVIVDGLRGLPSRAAIQPPRSALNLRPFIGTPVGTPDGTPDGTPVGTPDGTPVGTSKQYPLSV